MRSGPLHDIVQQLRQAAERDGAERTDAELLTRYVNHRDHEALCAIVHRHAPMVWGVCRRTLPNHHAVEDAFQATFLVLVRRADSIGARELLGNWLYGVARRTAVSLKGKEARRGVLERQLAEMPDPAVPEAGTNELSLLLDQELSRLPEKYRGLIVLCDLENQTRVEVARQLAMPEGTVASRLARAREMLAKRLTRRGLMLSVATMTTELARQAVSARAPASLIETVICFDRRTEPGHAGSASEIPAHLSRLAESGTQSLLSGKILGACIGLALSMVAMSAGVIYWPRTAETKEPPEVPSLVAAVGSTEQERRDKTETPDRPAVVRLDADGIPLPEGALTRLGSARGRFAGGTNRPLVFSADGRRVTIQTDKALLAVDALTGKVIRETPFIPPDFFTWDRLIDHGKFLAFGSKTEVDQLTLMRTEDAREEANWKVPSTGLPGTGIVRVTDIAPEGQRTLAVDGDNQVKTIVFLWDPKKRAITWSINYPTHVWFAKFTGDGKRFVVFGRNRLSTHDSASGKELGSTEREEVRWLNEWTGFGISLEGKVAAHNNSKGGVNLFAYAGVQGDKALLAGAIKSAEYASKGSFFFSPDGRFLVGLGTQVWDLQSKTAEKPFVTLPNADTAGFSSDGKTLALAGEGFVSFWSVGDWKMRNTIELPLAGVESVNFSSDGRRVIGHTSEGWASWSVGDGPLKKTMLSRTSIAETSRQDVASVSSNAQSSVVLVTPNGEPYGWRTWELKITDLTNGKELRKKFTEHPPFLVTLTPNGRNLSYLEDKKLKVIDSRTGELIREHANTKERSNLFGAHLTADGRKVTHTVSGKHHSNSMGFVIVPYETVHLDNLLTGQRWSLFTDPVIHGVDEAKFSDDGDRLLVRGSVTNGAEVGLWDTRNGRRIAVWEHPFATISTSAPAPDYRSLLMGDMSGNLTLLESATGGTRVAFRHRDRIRSAALSRDGTKAVASSSEAPVYVWDLLGSREPWDARAEDGVWKNLGSPDAKVGFEAMQRLRCHPAEGLRFLEQRLQPPELPKPEALAKMINRLNSAEYKEREQAQNELAPIADFIRNTLTERAKTDAAESRERINQLLKSADGEPSFLRVLRSMEVLESMATPEAGRILQRWTNLPEGSRLREEALDSLARLKRPPGE